MTYPKRGEISEDGKFYTHTDGSVHERDLSMNEEVPICDDCSMLNCLGTQLKGGCSMREYCGWSRIEGAYVPSAEEQAACDMALAMIVKCGGPESTRCLYYGGGYLCDDITNKTCPARAYLAAHGDANAWETNG